MIYDDPILIAMGLTLTILKLMMTMRRLIAAAEAVTVAAPAAAAVVAAILAIKNRRKRKRKRGILQLIYGLPLKSSKMHITQHKPTTKQKAKCMNQYI